MQKPQFVNNEFYHIYNRGVEKRNIFLDEKDYFRFIHDLFEFNDENLTLNTNYYLKKDKIGGEGGESIIGVQLPYIKAEREPRKLLVSILGFCQMPNHYHLILRQRKEGGIVRFMQKLGTGYTNYFNQKQERVGPLFQGRFKAVHINQEEHLQHLFFYVHFNSLDLIEPAWREGKINDYQKTIKFLDSYRWSSYLDYIGKHNFPSVTQDRDFFLEVLGGFEGIIGNTKEWLKEISQLREIDTKEFNFIMLD